MSDTIEILRAELAAANDELAQWKSGETWRDAQAELAAERGARQRAEAETERIRNLSLHFCDGPADDPNVLLRRRFVNRLLAIERETRALIASWDAHVYDSDGPELAALRAALEAK